MYKIVNYNTNIYSSFSYESTLPSIFTIKIKHFFTFVCYLFNLFF